MAASPYEIIGVDIDATPEQIRKEYKCLAGIHHPDKNIGDPYAKTRFQIIKNAYDILKDADRRARLDRGENTDTFEARPPAINILVSLMIDQLQTKGDRNIIGNMRQALHERVNTNKQAHRQCSKAAANIGKTVDRFTYSGQERNILADAIQDQSDKTPQQLAGIQNERAALKYAGELLDSYADVADPELQFITTFSGSSATTG